MATTEFRQRGVSPERLNDKQRAFVEEYMIDYNAKRAAATVGFTGVHAGLQLLKNPMIKRAIGALQQRVSNERKLSKEIVMEQLFYMVTRNMSDFADPETGKLTTDLTKLNRRALESIDSIEQDSYVDDQGREHFRNKFKLVSKMSALEAAMKHFGMFAPTEVNHTVTLDFDRIAGVIKDDRAEIEQRLIAGSTPMSNTLETSATNVTDQVTDDIDYGDIEIELPLKPKKTLAELEATEKIVQKAKPLVTKSEPKPSLTKPAVKLPNSTKPAVKTTVMSREVKNMLGKPAKSSRIPPSNKPPSKKTK